MPEPLKPVTATRRTGTEPLHVNGRSLPYNLLAFWQWSCSDLVSNLARGRLAEFIVTTALDIDVGGVRNEWDAVDLTTRGGIKVEVKCAAYVQSWYQTRLSAIVWRTPRTHEWSAATNRLSAESRRQADVYVFALLHHQDKKTIDPLDLEQWCFFVLPTRVLDARTRSQHSITLKSLTVLVGEPVPYSGLSEAVKLAGKVQRGPA
jgi:hypothetical protein